MVGADPRVSDYLFAQFGVTGLVVLAIIFVLYKLSADFAKLRTDLQQQLTRDLLNKRFGAYDELWSRLRTLAAYTDELLSSETVRGLLKTLSDWYFSTNGGLFLTVRTRDFYFSLQDLLRVAAGIASWKCERRPDQPHETFRLLVRDLLAEQTIANFQLADLEHPESLDPRVWRNLCRAIGSRHESMAHGNDPKLGDTVFVVLQQVSSFLRSNLADGLHSRLEARNPKPI